MSVMPIWAMTEPSINSTIECTIDCGWTTTSICEAGSPNSQCASITSRPLFISVAESIVIFWPICQVGCFSASAAVTCARLSRRAAAERPARRGQDQAPHVPGRTPVQALMNGVVLAVDRQHCHAVPAGRLHHQAAGHHQHFLVGEGDGLAAGDGGEHGLERRRARRGAEHDVDVGMGGHRDQSVGAARRKGWPVVRRPSACRPASEASATTAGQYLRTCSANTGTLLPAARATTRRRPGGCRRPTAHSSRSNRSSRGWRCASCG